MHATHLADCVIKRFAHASGMEALHPLNQERVVLHRDHR
jgi:hypothetical protein